MITKSVQYPNITPSVIKEHGLSDEELNYYDMIYEKMSSENK